MMAIGAAIGVLPTIELCHGQRPVFLSDMFAKRPPPEIIDLFDFFIRTFEKGDILFHPFPGFGIGYQFDYGFFLLIIIKGLSIVLVVRRVQQGHVLGEARQNAYK